MAQSIETLTSIARDLDAHMADNGLNGPAETLRWARERNAGVGWATYADEVNHRQVVQVALGEDELFLTVGLAVALHTDEAFYGALLGEDDSE